MSPRDPWRGMMVSAVPIGLVLWAVIGLIYWWVTR